MKLKYKIVFLLLFIPLLRTQAVTSAERQGLVGQLLQRIEILQQEVRLFQLLLANMKQAAQQNYITAPSYLAVNLSDNSVLLEKNPNQVNSIASVTKLITALIALENINPDQKITLTKKMLKPLGQSPVLFEGLNITAENLLKAALIQSTNDAAESLTYFLGKEKFITLMNQKAKELKMLKTSFSDSHGLSLANRSTAADLARLVAYIYKNRPEILTITKNNDFWLPDKTGRLLKFQNVNNFYPLDNFAGGKTGYLPQARQTLAGVFNAEKGPVAIVILNSKNRQADAFAILNKIKNN